MSGNKEKEKCLDVATVKNGETLLIEAEDDLVYEFVKGDKPLSAIVTGGRGQFKDTKVSFVTKKIRRLKPINLRVGNMEISTNNIVSIKLISSTYSLEIWEGAINENFGPG